MSNIKVRIHLNNDEYIDISKNNGLKSVESLSQSTAQPKDIFYGVLPNSGNVEIIDYNGKFLELIKQGENFESVGIDVLKDDNKIQSHISSINDYQTISKTVKINLTDSLSNWEKINFLGYNYPDKEESAYDLLINVFKFIGKEQEEVDEMLSNYIFDNNDNLITIKQYLQNINLEFPVLPLDNFKSIINKFCVLSQLNVYVDNYGKIKFISARPVSINKDNPIYIPKKHQFSQLDKSVLHKNKYDNVQLPKYNIVNGIDYEVLVDSADFTQNNAIITTDSATSINPIIPSNGTITVSEAVMNMTATFYSGCVKIKKQREHNLKNVINLYSGVNDKNEAQIKHNVYCSHRTGTMDAQGNIEWGEFEKLNTTFESLIYSVPYGTAGFYPAVSVPNQTNLKTLTPELKTDENGDEYYEINFIVAVGWTGTAMSRSTITGDNQGGVAEEYIPEKLEISFFGDVREIMFEQLSNNEKIIQNYKNPVSISGSELLTNKTKISNQELNDIITNNILKDYLNGVSDGKIKICCLDYFDVLGNKVIDWEVGQIINIGDVVKLEGDENIWRVTGRNFIYKGVPVIDLELQEVVKPTYVLSFNSEGGTNVDKKIIEYGEIIGSLETPIKTNYKFIGWQIDGVTITADMIYTYKENKTAVAIWEPAIKTIIDFENTRWNFYDDAPLSLDFYDEFLKTTNGNALQISFSRQSYGLYTFSEMFVGSSGTKLNYSSSDVACDIDNGWYEEDFRKIKIHNFRMWNPEKEQDIINWFMKYAVLQQ